MGVEILVPDSSIDIASGNEDLSVRTSARKANSDPKEAKNQITGEKLEKIRIKM